ncbi:MAG TPA: hypothetical protein VGX02_06525 [Candidatus Eremiobacteraceae bacterium]|jgi:hypothetical protein|nr:hypothetical protein [Candidatus Eremiobacteraceae bacterium]
MPVVVGIFPNYAEIKKLMDSVKAASLDLEALVVIADEAPDSSLISSGVQFNLTGEPDEGLLTSERGIITSSGGTEVPGLIGQQLPQVVGEDNVDALLADLGVPDKRSEEYEMAIDAGRCVAGYPATDNVDTIKDLFTGAGAISTEVFED